MQIYERALRMSTHFTERPRMSLPRLQPCGKAATRCPLKPVPHASPPEASLSLRRSIRNCRPELKTRACGFRAISRRRFPRTRSTIHNVEDGESTPTHSQNPQFRSLKVQGTKTRGRISRPALPNEIRNQTFYSTVMNLSLLVMQIPHRAGPLFSYVFPQVVQTWYFEAIVSTLFDSSAASAAS